MDTMEWYWWLVFCGIGTTPFVTMLVESETKSWPVALVVLGGLSIVWTAMWFWCRWMDDF